MQLNALILQKIPGEHAPRPLAGSDRKATLDSKDRYFIFGHFHPPNPPPIYKILYPPLLSINILHTEFMRTFASQIMVVISR